MPDVLPGWPRCLSRDQAATYLGVSVSTFDDEVKSGYWPRPQQRGMKGGKLTWDRLLLDAAQDKHSRLGATEPAAQDVDPGEAAWMERIRGTTPQQRPEHRPQEPRRRVG